MHTEGWVTQDQPNSDAQLFYSAANAAGTGSTNAGVVGSTTLLGAATAAATTGNSLINISGLLTRLGILMSSNYATNRSQEAFGTKAGVPGPSAVAGTSSPLAFGVNAAIPPILKANLATLKGSTSGALAKGVQINYVDFIYQILGGTATSLTYTINKMVVTLATDIAIATTQFATGTLSTAVSGASGNVHRQRVTLTSPVPAMLTDDTDIIAVKLVTVNPASVTGTFAGVVLGCSYNYN